MSRVKIANVRQSAMSPTAEMCAAGGQLAGQADQAAVGDQAVLDARPSRQRGNPLAGFQTGPLPQFYPFMEVTVMT